MYDSDYEYDVLGVLRLLRFVQMYRPHRAAHLVYGETAFSVEEILEFLYYSMEEIFDDCYSDYDEMNGSEILYIYDSVFDEYLDLSVRLSDSHLCSVQAARRRFEDVVTFFLADRNCGIFDVTIHYNDSSPQIQVEFAEGYYEPAGVVMAFTDLIHYLYRETERMNQIIEKRSGKIVSLMQKHMEEAA